MKLLLDRTGLADPSDANEAQLIAWATAASANNTVRGRISVAVGFFTWRAEDGHPIPDLRRLKALKRSYPALYGKAQGKNPARWLDQRDAFQRLIAACQDGTLVGLRDETIIRLGLAGMRKAEIADLPVSALTVLPAIQWTGKGNRARRIVAGANLHGCITRLLDAYPDPQPHDPLICRNKTGSSRPAGGRIDWHTGYSPGRPSSALHLRIQLRARQAGLGHVAPHDLRRSAAGILHHDLSADGGHRFDLLDIQKFLGHADPATTMRSYLDPIDTDVLDRAATVLD